MNGYTQTLSVCAVSLNLLEKKVWKRKCWTLCHICYVFLAGDAGVPGVSTGKTIISLLEALLACE